MMKIIPESALCNKLATCIFAIIDNVNFRELLVLWLLIKYIPSQKQGIGIYVGHSLL